MHMGGRLGLGLGIQEALVSHGVDPVEAMAPDGSIALSCDGFTVRGHPMPGHRWVWSSPMATLSGPENRQRDTVQRALRHASARLLDERETLCIDGEGTLFLQRDTDARASVSVVSSELADFLNARERWEHVMSPVTAATFQQSVRPRAAENQP